MHIVKISGGESFNQLPVKFLDSSRVFLRPKMVNEVEVLFIGRFFVCFQ